MSDVTFGTLPAPRDELARRAKRHGIWYNAEYGLRAKRAWGWSILLNAVGQPLVYLVAMGVGLGALVDSRGGLGDVPYLVFVAPAILVTTISMSSAGESMYPVMGGFKWHRLFYAPHATPSTPRQIAGGLLLSSLIQFFAQAAVFVALMFAFGATRSGWAALLPFIAVLTSSSVFTPLMAYASTLEDDTGQFAVVQRCILMPLYLFSGTYFPLEAMPGWLQWIGWISPIWHGTQLARVANYGMVEPVWLTIVHVVVLLAFSGVGLAFAMRLFTRRLGR